MAMRTLAFMVVAVTLGGCMAEGMEPASEHRQLEAARQAVDVQLPYNQAAIADDFQRHIVEYHRKEAPGSVVVDIRQQVSLLRAAAGQSACATA